MSDTSELLNDSAGNTAPRRGVREWLADLFSDEPENLPELLAILRDAAERQLIQLDALNIIFGALQVSDMHARDIMIPRSALVVVGEDQTPEELLPTIVESRHSRFPVIGDDVDDIKGILHAKDLLPLLLAENHQNFAMRDCIRPAVLIPESKRLNVLLEEFRANRNHMALVVDEYGQISGAVTIEDVLEQIVGEIEDEHDPTVDTQIRQISQSNFMVQALTPISTFNDFFHTNFSDEEFDTIGGIISNLFGRLPKRNETINTNNLTFHVTHADNRRLYSVRVTLESDSESTKPDPE